MPEEKVADKATEKKYGEFGSLKALDQAMKDNPELAAQVIEDLRNEKTDRQVELDNKHTPPEFRETPVEPVVEKPEAKKDKKEKPAAKPEDKKEDKKEEPPKKVKIEVPEEIFGTYLTNRTPEEAAVEMAKGNKEKDKTIERLKELQRDKQTELDSKLAEIEQYRREKEQARAKPKPEEKQSAKPAEKVEVAEGIKIELPALPAVPEMPDMPSGDDFLDTEKRDKYVTAMQDYKKSRKARDDAEKAREDAEQKIWVGFSEKVSKLESGLKEYDGKIKEVKDKADSVEAKTELSERQIKQVEAVQNEIQEIDRFRARNPELFPSRRSVTEIENDYLGFVKELSEEIGEKDGIYLKDGQGKMTNTIKPSVTTAVNEYIDGTSDVGKKLKEKMGVRAAVIPEDVDDLFRVYKLRGIVGEKRGAVTMSEALVLAQAKDEDFRPVKKPEPKPADPKQKEKMDDVERIKRASEPERKVAVEPDPANSGGPGVNLDAYNPGDLQAILKKNKGDRTQAEVELLKKIEIVNNMRQGELTELR